jgi:hypothetical protein
MGHAAVAVIAKRFKSPWFLFGGLESEPICLWLPALVCLQQMRSTESRS